MARRRRSSNRSQAPFASVHKPRGHITPRVQAAGPEHFGIVSVDCAKVRSKFLIADYFGNLLQPPTWVEHTRAELQHMVGLVRQTIDQHQLRDVVIAIEQTGTYHRPVQQVFRRASFDTRLVHPFASSRFRQAADGDLKTDDKDLAGIFRAAVNGFGLQDPVWPDHYQQLQLLSRHRRDLVRKNARLRCQIREYLHALMPGYAGCFSDLFDNPIAITLARQTGSAEAVRHAGLDGLRQLARANGSRVRHSTLATIYAWANTAPPAHPQPDLVRQFLATLDDDRLSKSPQISQLEQQCAHRLVSTPYVLLLAIPGINVVSAADVAGELGPIDFYAHANHITGRAGLMPARYQSDFVDRQGSLCHAGHRRLRVALLQCADNLITHNHHFQVRSTHWRQRGKDPRWIHVKVAKSFSRIAYAIVAGRTLFPHPCCQPRHYIIDKLLEFHRLHDTPMPWVMLDIEAATAQLPRRTYDEEAQPLHERLHTINARRRGPQPLRDILPIVLARLGVAPLQSPAEDRDPG